MNVFAIDPDCWRAIGDANVCPLCVRIDKNPEVIDVFVEDVVKFGASEHFGAASPECCVQEDKRCFQRYS
jgi:hypothetical protein